MNIVLLVLSYLSMLMYFDLFYRLFTPKVRFSTAFLSFFLILVVICSSINAFIIPLHFTLLRMLIPQVIMFIWLCFCFDDTIEFKIFGIFIGVIITYMIEVSCMVIFYALSRQRLIELFQEPMLLLLLRFASIIANLAAYEIVLFIIRKYKIRKIPYFSIILPMLLLVMLIGNCIQNLATYKQIERMREIFIITIMVSALLLYWILKAIHKEYKKKSMAILHNEIEQQYQMLLNDYMNISDSELLQKYLRHDILNHLQILNEMQKESEG